MSKSFIREQERADDYKDYLARAQAEQATAEQAAQASAAPKNNPD